MALSVCHWQDAAMGNVQNTAAYYCQKIYLRKPLKFILSSGKLETVNTRLLNKISETVNRIFFEIILRPH